jgi:hypothetical protein
VDGKIVLNKQSKSSHCALHYHYPMQNHYGLCEMNNEIRITMLALCFVLFGFALYEDNPSESNFAVVHFKEPNQSQPMDIFDNVSLFSLTVTSIMKPNSSYNSNTSYNGITDENSGIIVLNHASTESQPSTNRSTESNFVVNETIPVDESTSSPSTISAELNATFFQTNSEIHDTNSKISSSNHT